LLESESFAMSIRSNYLLQSNRLMPDFKHLCTRICEMQRKFVLT